MAGRLPPTMSSKRTFQCFNAVGGECIHKSSPPFEHHSSRFPRIPQHGIVAHHEPLEECYHCSECRHAQALEALETQATSLYHSYMPYLHHHPQQYVLSRPTRPEENPAVHSGYNHHIHHHRYNKRVVLVKNSDPSFRRTIILHRRSLHSFGLFLEEVSELMQYHIRKVYTLEGCKIDNIQGLLQYSGVLICVGREPSHPSIVENLRKGLTDKLPRLNVRSRSDGCSEGREGLPNNKSSISPKLIDEPRSHRQSVSSEKMPPDRTDSVNNTDSCPNTSDGTREDDIEKRVCVNKDGSLSMEMKVRFRLQNKETLQWSTKVRKTTGKSNDYFGRPNFAQVSDISYSESENISGCEQDEAYSDRHYQRRAEEPQRPHCYRHCQEYDIWKNIPGGHGASCCIQTSGSSASSHTVVSKKMLVERQTMSRSSEEHTEHVVESETCVETVEMAKTVETEYCSIRSETHSPSYTVESSVIETCEVNSSPNEVNAKTVQTPGQNQQMESAPYASSEDQNDDASASDSSAKMETGSQMSPGRMSNASESSSHKRKSKKLYACKCKVSKDLKGETKGQIVTQAEDVDVERDQSSAMSVKSSKSKEAQNMEFGDAVERRSKSAMSVHSNASKSVVTDVTAEEAQDVPERPSSSASVHSSISTKTTNSDILAGKDKPQEDVDVEQSLSSMSLASTKSKGSRVSVQSDKEQAVETDERAASALSATLTASTYSKPSNGQNEENAKEDNQDQSRASSDKADKEEMLESVERSPSTMSVKSIKSNTSLRSRKSGASDLPSGENLSENKESERPFSAMSARSIKSEASARSRQSKRSEGHTKIFDISDDGNKSENEERPQSGMSVKSAKSTVSVKSTLSSISAKSRVSKQADISAEESGAEHTETRERALSNMSTVSKSSAVSKKSTGSAVPSHTCDDAPVIERDADICDHNENAERAPSNLSVRSGKSSKSNISAMSRRSKVSELVLEDGGDSPEEIMVERETEGRALSSADRTPSALSAKSDKSNASTKSVKSNASQACCESQERAQSATSAKTAKSTISDKSSKEHDDQPEENRSDHEEQEERSASSMSIRSGNSAKSNVSTSSGRSNVSEVPLQDLLDNPNEGTDEVESMSRPVSSLSTQSVRSNISKRSKKSDSYAHDSLNEENSKKQTEGRASSVQSHVSEVSEERAHSAQSSTRSVKSNAAVVCSSRAIGSPNEGDGEEVSQERAQSAMSTKTTKSTISAKSSKSKVFEVSSEHRDRAPSNMSVRSAKSAKSNVSAASMKSQTSNVLTADHTDDSCEEMKEEEFTESRSASLLSVHSTKSSVKSRGSKCSADAHESSITRPRSHTSTASMKSDVSEIPPDSETPEVRNDEEDIQDRAKSAMSAKSSISDVSSSVRSKTSKCASDVPTEESFENPNGENDREQRQRAASSISIQSHVSERSVNSQASGSDVAENKKTAERTASSLSKKSARSHVSGRSKSNASEVVFGFSDNENGEEKTQARAQSGLSASSTHSTMSVKSSKSKIDVPSEDYGSAHHRSKERPESAQSDRSAKSFTSTLSRRSKDTIASERTAEEEIGSHMSVKSDSSVEVDAESEAEKRSPSNRSVKSAKSHISVSSRSMCEVCLEQADNGETVQRSPSSLSVRSARSAKSTQSVNSKASKRSKNSKVSEAPVKESMNTNEEITEDSEARPGSSMSARTNRSNVTSISTKSNGSHNVDCKQDVGNEAEKQAPSFTKSLMSTGKSSPSKSTENTGECDETEDGSSMSNKSVKSDLSQRSKNSKVSGQTLNTHSELDHSVERTPSVLSGKTHISAKSVESSVSLITPSDRTGNEETDARAHSEISTTESPCTTEEVNAEEKSNRAKSAMSTKSNLSVRSRKSKVSDVIADENIHDKEGRILSPVSAKSLQSEVLSCPEIPAVMVEESQDRASTKSKVSVHSEVSTSKNTERKSNGRPRSSLSVKSNISVKSTKSKDNLTDEYGKGNEEIMTPTETDISAEETISVNAEEDVIPSTRSLHEDGKQDEVDKKSCHSKTSKSSRQRRKNVNAEIYKPKSVADSAESDTSKKEQQLNFNKRCVICHTESVETDLSQTLSSSNIVKDTGEIPQPKSKSDAQRSVTDNKSDKSSKSKSKSKSKNGDDSKLVPSNLPNTSPTEVVNEWLKKIPADGEMYDMEGLNENGDGQKNYTTDEREKGTYDSSAAENTTDETEGDVLNTVPNMDCQTSQEEPNVDNTHEEGNGASNIFNSSIQVMKVLLNPKIDRCNSLPEISPVYGRKLSTSARGLLDCLVKLQLIDTNPNNANEKDERYQELMNILQSLWLCVPQESEQELRRDHHCFVDDECNHTSSSGVDVNSGSAGSGKSSDGVNADAPQLHTTPNVFNEVQEACEGKAQPDAQWPHERENKGICHNEQKEDDQATNDTIRSNDSPSPPSSNKSSGSDSGGKIPPEEIETDGKVDTSYEIPSLFQKPQLPKRITQDPDPLWVLTLLTKIEKQFMKHYVNAMREFKVRWQLDDNEQLDGMINELKNEVQKRIQRSIDRELKKIQIRVGLPRPPKEAISRSAVTQPEDRRRRLKMTLKRSIDSQANKSDDSATCTSYSDQRSENDDEYCPCETCIKNKMTSRPPLSTEAQKSAPVLADFNLKNILEMKTCDPNKTEAINCTSYSGSEAEICAAGKLVENVIVNAVKDVEGDGTENGIDEEESAAETVKAVATGNIEMAAAESATVEDDMMAEDISAEHRTVKEQVIEAGEVERDEDGAEELSVEPAEEAASKDKSETGRENADTGEEELMEEVAQAVTTGDVNAAEETDKAAIDKNDCDIEETETAGGEEEIPATEANNSFDEASNITIEDELKGASEATIAEKEDATAMSATSEHESDKEDNMVEAVNDEKIIANSSDESVDYNNTTETAHESWRKQAATVGGEIGEYEATDETAAEEAAMAALRENALGKDDGDKEGNVGTDDEDEIAASTENELSEEAAEANTPEDGNVEEEVEMALPRKQESDEVVSVEQKMVELTSNNADDSAHEKDETTTADESERSFEDESREEVAEDKSAAEQTPLAVLSEHESGKDDNEEAETVNDEDETAELNEEAAEAIAAEGENADAGEMGSTSKQEPYEEMAVEEEMTDNKDLTDNSVNEKSETADEAEETAGATSEDEAIIIKDDSSATEDESREERAEDGISVGDTTGADLAENESENEQTGKETLATAEVESVDEKKDTSINDDSSARTGSEAETTAVIAEGKDHPVISEEEQKEEVQTEDDNAAENVTDTSEDESDEEASVVARAVEEVEADTTTDSGEDATSNEDAPAEEPKEPVDEATSEDELIVEKEFAVESEDGFQDEDPEATAADDEMDLTKDKSREDYADDETPAESESEHEEGMGKESLTTSADDSADENNDTATADRSSKGAAGKPESEDEIDDDEENAITSEDDSVEDAPSNVECTAEENDATGNDLTKETSEEATTENKLEFDKEFGIKTEDELEKETTELTIDRDDTAEESSTIAVTDEHESDKVEAAEMSDDEEKLSVTSTDESANDTVTADKDVDKAESEDETAPDKDQDEPRKEIANDEIRSVESAKDAKTELQSDEEPMEDESVKDEDTTAINDDDSAENATTNVDGTESDCTDDEQPKATEAAISEDGSTGDNEMDTDEFKDESAEAINVEDKNTVEETDIAAITEDEIDDSEEEKPEGKDTVATHEDEGSTEKDEEGKAIAENEFDRDTDVEATSSEESEPHETETAKKAAAEAEIAITSEDEIKEETDDATVAEVDTTEQDPLEEEETEACDDAEDTAVSREDEEDIDDEGTDNPAEAATSEDEAERKDGITTNEENAKEEDTEGAKETGNSSDEESGALVEGQECECEHSKSQQEEVAEGEMAGEQSEEDDESAGKSIRAGEDCTEVATTEDEVEEHEGIGEPETMANGAIEREKSADYSEDESAEDNRQHITEGEVLSENAASESGTNPDEDEKNKQTDVTEEHPENHITVRSDETNGANDVVGVKPGEDEDEGEEEESKVGSPVNDSEDAITASNKEEVEAQTAKETWSANRGDSADAEDEADDSDGSDQESNDSETEDFVTNKVDHQEAAKKPQETFVLKKVSAESEDGAYGDAEDSETEMNCSEEPNKPGVKDSR